MSTLDRVEGRNIILRLIKTDDAEYVHALRTDPAYSRHLSAVKGDVEDQRKWIEDYKIRETEGIELYYVIECKDGRRCGVVRLYNIGADNFTWGSWILDAGKPEGAALESAVLSFGVGFKILGRENALVDVRADNKRAIAFYRRFGMTETHRTEQDIYFAYSRAKYEADHAGFLASAPKEA